MRTLNYKNKAAECDTLLEWVDATSHMHSIRGKLELAKPLARLFSRRGAQSWEELMDRLQDHAYEVIRWGR